eukprot:310983-Hanusia_phi.AAC.5
MSRIVIPPWVLNPRRRQEGFEEFSGTFRFKTNHAFLKKKILQVVDGDYKMYRLLRTIIRRKIKHAIAGEIFDQGYSAILRRKTKIPVLFIRLDFVRSRDYNRVLLDKTKEYTKRGIDALDCMIGWMYRSCERVPVGHPQHLCLQQAKAMARRYPRYDINKVENRMIGLTFNYGRATVRDVLGAEVRGGQAKRAHGVGGGQRLCGDGPVSRLLREYPALRGRRPGVPASAYAGWEQLRVAPAALPCVPGPAERSGGGGGAHVGAGPRVRADGGCGLQGRPDGGGPHVPAAAAPGEHRLWDPQRPCRVRGPAAGWRRGGGARGPQEGQGPEAAKDMPFKFESPYLDACFRRIDELSTLFPSPKAWIQTPVEERPDPMWYIIYVDYRIYKDYESWDELKRLVREALIFQRAFCIEALMTYKFDLSKIPSIDYQPFFSYSEVGRLLEEFDPGSVEEYLLEQQYDLSNHNVELTEDQKMYLEKVEDRTTAGPRGVCQHRIPFEAAIPGPARARFLQIRGWSGKCAGVVRRQGVVEA